MDGAAQRKDERIAMRATPRQVEVIDRAAEALDKSRSEFILDVVLEESRRVLADRRLFILDDEGRDQFLRLLDAPPRPIPELRALFRRGSVLGKDDGAARSR